MDYILLKDFLARYSLPTLIIAFVCAVTSIVIDLCFKERLPRLVKSYLPFLTAIALYFAYDMIFALKAFAFSDNSFYAGVLSGSLSVLIKKTALKIAQGKNVGISATALLIEGLLSEYVSDGALTETARVLEKILLSENLDENDAVNQVLLTIKEKVNGERSESELTHLAKLIVSAVRSFCDN